MEDFESSAEDLRAIYPHPGKLCDKLIHTWIEVLNFFGAPRVSRTADAFARRLIAEGTIKAFSTDCISNDNSPVPGLEEALASALGPPGSRDQFDWMSSYADEPPRKCQAVALYRGGIIGDAVRCQSHWTQCSSPTGIVVVCSSVPPLSVQATA